MPTGARRQSLVRDPQHPSPISAKVAVLCIEVQVRLLWPPPNVVCKMTFFHSCQPSLNHAPASLDPLTLMVNPANPVPNVACPRSRSRSTASSRLSMFQSIMVIPMLNSDYPLYCLPGNGPGRTMELWRMHACTPLFVCKWIQLRGLYLLSKPCKSN